MDISTILIPVLVLASVAFLIFRAWQKRKKQSCGEGCGCEDVKLGKKNGLTSSGRL